MKSIILIGLPSSGKSFIGELLAKQLKIDIIDTDTLIIQKIGSQYPNIINIRDCYRILGEKKFREVETEILKEIYNSKSVISSGGGLILKPENIKLLKALGTIFYLQVPLHVLQQRIKNQKSRLLLESGKKSTLKALKMSREPFYIEIADFIINGDKSTRLIIEDIIKLNQY